MSDDRHSLKFDRRLLRRRGWVDPEELRRHLESLPDASSHIRSPDEEPEGGGSPPAGSGGSGDGAAEPPTS